MFVVSVVSCQVEVSETGLSLVQRSPTAYGVSECDRRTSPKRPRPLEPLGKKVTWPLPVATY